MPANRSSATARRRVYPAPAQAATSRGISSVPQQMWTTRLRPARRERRSDPGLGALARRVEEHELGQAGRAQAAGQEGGVDPPGEEVHAVGAAQVDGVGARRRDGRAVEIHPDHLGGLAADGEGEQPVAAVEVEQGAALERRQQGAHGGGHDRHHRAVDLREDRRREAQPHPVGLDLQPVGAEEPLERERPDRPFGLEVVLGAARVEVEERGPHAQAGRLQVEGELLARPHHLGVEDAHVQDDGESPGRAADDRPVERRRQRARREPRQPFDQERVDRRVLGEVESGGGKATPCGRGAGKGEGETLGPQRRPALGGRAVAAGRGRGHDRFGPAGQPLVVPERSPEPPP